MFENLEKSLIQHCEKSELFLYFETKVKNAKNGSWKLEAFGQTVLPDR